MHGGDFFKGVRNIITPQAENKRRADRKAAEHEQWVTKNQWDQAIKDNVTIPEADLVEFKRIMKTPAENPWFKQADFDELNRRLAAQPANGTGGKRYKTRTNTKSKTKSKSKSKSKSRTAGNRR